MSYYYTGVSNLPFNMFFDNTNGKPLSNGLGVSCVPSNTLTQYSAAIVVPTGFLTAQNGIEKAVREKLVKDKMIKGVISMPSNIFANTGTNVSVLFIDKGNQANDIILIDASKLGTKIKDGKNQRTVLSHEEENLINLLRLRNCVMNTTIFSKSYRSIMTAFCRILSLSNTAIATSSWHLSASQWLTAPATHAIP